MIIMIINIVFQYRSHSPSSPHPLGCPHGFLLERGDEGVSLGPFSAQGVCKILAQLVVAWAHACSTGSAIARSQGAASCARHISAFACPSVVAA